MKLLEKLTQTDGASGNEARICECIKAEIEKYCDESYIDAMGNLIAHKSGEGKKLMLSAHMDEIGVIITFIDDNGYLRFSQIGGLYIKELAHRRVRFANGIIGVIGSEEEEFEKKPAIDRLYIDIGAKNKADAEKGVNIGDTAVFTGEYIEQNGAVISKALDNRIGCYALIEAAKKLKNNKNDLYFAFTVQEEVGLRGAKTAAYQINPDYAVAVDVTDTGDTPKAPKMAVRLGGGAAIKVMDRSVLCDAELRNMMVEAAKKSKIPYQLEIMADGGTDAGAIHLTRAGIKTGGISIPARYIHSPAEIVQMSDVENCVKLITRLAEIL